MVSVVLLKMWHCVVGPYALPFCRSKVRSCRFSSEPGCLERLPKSATEFKSWRIEKGRHHFLFVSNCLCTLCKLAQNGRSSVKVRIPNRLALWLGAAVAGCEGLV